MSVKEFVAKVTDMSYKILLVESCDKTVVGSSWKVMVKAMLLSNTCPEIHKNVAKDPSTLEEMLKYALKEK